MLSPNKIYKISDHRQKVYNKPMGKKVAVVIVNYNAGDALLTCIRSVFESQLQPAVIVVDNGSRDGSLEKVKRSYSKLSYIVNSHNLGFAAGANVGARYALERMYDHIIFLNPDAALGKNCLEQLVEGLADDNVGIAAPLIYRTQDKSLWFAGGEIDWRRHRATHKMQIPTQGGLLDSEFITGCVMAVHARTFQKVELFDEKFFLYYEDVDLSLRTQKAGLRTVIVPQAIAWHAEHSEQNKPQKTYFLILSGLIFFAKHASGFRGLWFKLFTFARSVNADIKALLNGNEMTLSVQKAFKDYKDVKKTRNIIPYRTLQKRERSRLMHK